MKKYVFLILIAGIAGGMAIMSCSSSSSPTTTTTITNQFALTVGNKFQFSLVINDTSGNPIQADQKSIHETVVANALTFAGVSNVYMCIDTVFNATGSFDLMDTILYATNGTYLLQYGFVTWAIDVYTGGGLQAPPKWDTIAKIGSSAWIADTTNNVHSDITAGSTVVPVLENYLLNGADNGATSVTVGSNSYSADQSKLNGSLTGTGTYSGLPIGLSATLQATIDVTYNPTIPASIVTPIVSVPITLAGSAYETLKYGGYSRTMTSYSAQ